MRRSLTVWLCGAVAVPVARSHSEDDVTYLLADAGCSVLAITPDVAGAGGDAATGGKVGADKLARMASESGRDALPALVIGQHYITERDSVPVQYNGIV